MKHVIKIIEREQYYSLFNFWREGPRAQNLKHLARLLRGSKGKKLRLYTRRYSQDAPDLICI